MQKISEYIYSITNIDSMYIFLIISTVLIILGSYVIKWLVKKIIVKTGNARKEYVYNKNFQTIITVVEWLLIICLWSDYIKSIITLVSFISAAVAIAVRDLILNWFCGIYIKIKKPFRLEDRIEIDGVKGDVVNISSLSFEMLEISDDELGGQSTGIIVSFPNSIIFSKPLKNYTKGFKYIWQELTINVSITSDISATKHEIYKIVNGIDIIRSIPKKMKNQVSNVATTYRVYFNKYDPIIYTKVVDGHVELKVRYLIHPKKARYVESIIWNKILVLHHNGNIELYGKD